MKEAFKERIKKEVATTVELAEKAEANHKGLEECKEDKNLICKEGINKPKTFYREFQKVKLSMFQKFLFKIIVISLILIINYCLGCCSS